MWTIFLEEKEHQISNTVTNFYAHIKTISTKEKIVNVLYTVQKITVDITTIPYAKEFIPKIKHTK